MKRLRILYLFLLSTLFACQSEDMPDVVATAFQQLPDQLDFNIHVKPILSDKCFACHGPDKANQKAGLRLDLPTAAFAELPETPGKKAITPHYLKKSEVYHRILSEDQEMVMPPPEFKLALSPYEKAVLIKWIKSGAEYKPHWAFLKPNKPIPPRIKNLGLVNNEIDQFVLAKLETKNLLFNPQADKRLLLRRLSLDLTGLPPSLEEMDAFLADDSADAYEKQVDRLLDSPHFGEKMAVDWMDVARYSDTYGYQVDRYRDMSPWRDWVIQAFNENQAFDQFLTWQLAGDLLPNASRAQIIATGFNRLHPQNMEGGIVDEEFRVENVSDRVAVLGDGILGITLSCAKCHDHKYDPISQKEYYEVYSFFNNINETGQISWDKGTPVPNLLIPTPAQASSLKKLEARIEEEIQQLASISQEEQEAIQAWIVEGEFQILSNTLPKNGLIAAYSMDEAPIRNRAQPRQVAKMDREFSAKEMPRFTAGLQGNALLLDGDAWLECTNVGIFKRSDPFSISLWIYLPPELKEGVIFHKNKGAMLHAFRGYHLALKDGQLEWVMARTWPENAIIMRSFNTLPKNQWLQLTVSYDGSSEAKGTTVYLDGVALKMEVEKDNLYKDIVFNYLEDIIYPEPIEPSLQIGARWRGKGIKGAKVDEILVYDRALTPLEILQITSTNSLNSEAFDSLGPQHLEAYYLNNYSKAYQAGLERLQTLRTSYVDSMERVQEVMIMQEMEEPRKTYVLNRGVYDDYGEAVSPSTPSSIMDMPEDFPKNRLGLAKWLTHPDHPLTARVAVNRYWQNYFGQGLVETSQDFGNQGTLPSHPALLDWLATTFVESGWDIKALQKKIVMSATYQQSSQATKESLAKDSENKWLSRGPSLRLTSEMLRDNALSASGLMNPELGGESVFPYQPEGLWAMNFDPYTQSEGADLYRRSMYTIWRRTIPNPTLATFDQPDRNVCTVKRQKTNTPLQALVLLNDPTFVEAAKVLGEQMARTSDPQKAIESAYLKLTGIQASPKELDILLQLRNEEYAVFQRAPEKMKGWLEAGTYTLDETLEPASMASYAVVASVILNSDATITKR